MNLKWFTKNKTDHEIIKINGIKTDQIQKIDFKKLLIYSHAIQEFHDKIKKIENAEI